MSMSSRQVVLSVLSVCSFSDEIKSQLEFPVATCVPFLHCKRVSAPEI